MCFSANASFGAGIVLTVVGVVTIRRIKRSSQLPFAAIPLVFAAQQLTEGILWTAMNHPEYVFLERPATYIFLFIAQIVWPVWVPWSIMLLDKKEDRKISEKILVGMGAALSLFLGYCLLNYHVEADMSELHMAYIQDYPVRPRHFGSVFYVITTIVPPFFSRYRGMWTLGAAILISYLATTIFYNEYVVSVWCFFAAIISFAVFFIVRNMTKVLQNQNL